MDREELVGYISDVYGVSADYPFLQYPDVAVFRHNNNKKWFAVIMRIPKSKLGIDSEEEIDIVNFKCSPVLTGSLRNETGMFPAYHMNKSNWISVALDGSADAERIKWLIDISYELTAKKTKKSGKEYKNV